MEEWDAIKKRELDMFCHGIFVARFIGMKGQYISTVLKISESTVSNCIRYSVDPCDKKFRGRTPISPTEERRIALRGMIKRKMEINQIMANDLYEKSEKESG